MNARLSDDGLALIVDDLPPVAAAFTDPALKKRLLQASRKTEALARAVGMKPGKEAPAVLDCTAGLGRDGMLLAHLGCDVLMTEQHPLLFQLLTHSLNHVKSANAPPESIPAWSQRLDVLHANATAYLQPLSDMPRVIYLDPMHPVRRKSAAVKKNLQALQQLHGEPDEAASEALLAAALATNPPRAVSKRPANQPPLENDRQPDHSIDGGQMRFDVYLRRD